MSKVFIEGFVPFDKQITRLGAHVWSVPRLVTLARDLEVMDVPLAHLNLYACYEKLSLRQMVMHMRAVEAADLGKPIILDEDGEIMDGRHRIMKALLRGDETIKAVRFSVNPSPCRVEDNK